MSNYSKVRISKEPRVELHDQLGLTGAEISISTLKAGTGVPFVHSHKKNEEIYTVLSGKGRAVVDGEEVTLEGGEWIRIAPEGKRQFFAAEDSDLVLVCIQVKAGSLEEYTLSDGVIEKEA